MAHQSNGTDISLVAGADLSAAQFKAVKVNSSGQAILADADDLNAIGVLQNNPASGQTASVRIAGVTKYLAGGTVASGAVVTSDANGDAVATAVGKQPHGVAIVGGVDGDIISVLLGAGLSPSA